MDRLTWLMSCLLVDACGMRVSRGDSGVFCWGKDSYQAFSCIRLGEILTSPSGILKLHFTSHEGLAEGDLKPKSGNFLAFWSRAQPHVGWNVDKCRGYIFYIVYGCQGWQDDKKSTLATRMNKPTLPSFFSHPDPTRETRVFSRPRPWQWHKTLRRESTPIHSSQGAENFSPKKILVKTKQLRSFLGCDMDVSICSPW